MGQRVGKTLSKGDRVYVYDAVGHLAGEYDKTGARLSEHIYLADMPVAIIGPTGVVFPVLSDHLGTPRQVINASKQLRWRWDNTDQFSESESK